MLSYHLHPYMYQQQIKIQLVELVYAKRKKKFCFFFSQMKICFLTNNVYSIVVNCGESSAGCNCSEIPAYCGGKLFRCKQKLHIQIFDR